MLPLTEDLQTNKTSLSQFRELTSRVLSYIPNVITDQSRTKGYVIFSSTVAGTLKYVRPTKEDLFVFDEKEFDSAYFE